MPHPNTDVDWLTMTLAEHRNQISWFSDAGLMDWLCDARLDLMRHMYAPLMGMPQNKAREGVQHDRRPGCVRPTRSSIPYWSTSFSWLPQTAKAGKEPA